MTTSISRLSSKIPKNVTNLSRISSEDPKVNKKIKRVAVLGGSGSSAIQAAKRAKADAYITADLKYHDFFSAENQLLLVDGGHYETEQFTKYKIADFLKEKLPNFAIILANTNTNPVNYL